MYYLKAIVSLKKVSSQSRRFFIIFSSNCVNNAIIQKHSIALL